MFNRIKELNSEIEFYDVNDKEFATFVTPTVEDCGAFAFTLWGLCKVANVVPFVETEDKECPHNDRTGGDIEHNHILLGKVAKE